MDEKYYVKLDTSNWSPYQKGWLEYEQIVDVFEHKTLGYVKKVSKEEAMEIISRNDISNHALLHAHLGYVRKLTPEEQANYELGKEPNVIVHPIGLLKKLTEEEIKSYGTKMVKLKVYPDNDSTWFENYYPVEGIYRESIEKL